MTLSLDSGVIERYRRYLPVSRQTPIISLQEGQTPLLAAPRLAKTLGLPAASLYLKIEGMNPTGSFKDRGMTLAVSKALEAGSRFICCASTGNTAASAAAYAARAGIQCFVLLPQGGVALGKLSQALVYGAQVIEVKGNFDKALALLRVVAKKNKATIVNSLNPYRIEGQKTAAFEIIESLGRPPDYQFMPVGNGGNITAYWKGYKEYGQGKFGAKSKPRFKLPKIMGFQAKGAAPLVEGHVIAHPKTIASAIRIGNPVFWNEALKARDESGGAIDVVSDAEIECAHTLLARLEGVFCEPASAAAVAGLAKHAGKGFLAWEKQNQALRIVCILTGHGLKDPDSVAALRRRP